jgi:hypothetical protein
MTDRHPSDPLAGPGRESGRGRSVAVPKPAVARTAAATADPGVAASVSGLDRLTLRLGGWARAAAKQNPRPP